SISGRVLNIPEEANWISLELASGKTPHRITSGSSSTISGNGKLDSRFQLGHLGSGFYRLYARASMNDKPLRSQVVELNLTDSNYEDVELVLAPGSEVTGVVEWAGKSSVRKSPAEKQTLRLRQVRNPFDYMQMQPAEIGPDGTFKVTDVFADLYQVAVEPLPE